MAPNSVGKGFGFLVAALVLGVHRTWALPLSWGSPCTLIIPIPVFQSSWQNWKNTKGRKKSNSQSMKRIHTNKTHFVHI